MMCSFARALPALLVSFVSSSLAFAAVPQEACPAWSSSFGLPGTDGSVRAFATFDDGGGSALYAGGSFVSAGEAAALHVARWNGTTWSSVGEGFDGDVLGLAVLDDGSGPALYAGGTFAFSGATAVNGIARWNGASWSPLGGGMSGGNPNGVHALCAFDDGNGVAIYAGGRFTSAGGISARGIARWKNGAWSNLGVGIENTGSSTAFDANALAVYDEGSGPALYVGGYFNKAGGIPAGGMARWSGAHWSAVGSCNLTVYSLAVWDSGIGPELYAATDSGIAGGFDMYGIARWNGAWTPVGFGLGQSGVEGGTAYALQVHDDGSGSALYAGGGFSIADGLPAHNIARFDGTQWTNLATSLTSPVRALAAYTEPAGSALFIGGDFVSIDTHAALRIARRTASGYSAVGIGNGISGSVRALHEIDLGAGPLLVAGGGFPSAGNVQARNIAAFDGTSWSALSSGTSDWVYALATFDEGHGAGPVLFAGGAFTTAGDTLVHYIARWDGNAWTSVAGGTNYEIESFAVFDAGSGPALYVSGYFTTAGGIATPGSVARWDGNAWSSVGTPPPDGVHGLTVFDDGVAPALYGCSNTYTTNPPAYHSSIYKFDGTNWTTVGAQFNRFIITLHAHKVGNTSTLYAGVNGMGPDTLWRWDGASWISIPGLDNGPVYGVVVRAMATYDDGLGNAPSLIVAGAFKTAGGAPASNLARWDGSQWSTLGYAFGTEIETAGVYSLGSYHRPSAITPSLFAGGPFARGLGAPSNGIAERAPCEGPIVAYCFGDGSLTTACPCANFGAAGHGCANSSVPAGAHLSGSGSPSLASDTFVLQQSESLDHAFTIVLQGNATIGGGAIFGDGVRCAGGSLKRLYTKSAVAGVIVVPGAADASISARSAALGDTIPPGGVRNYQAYYRDPVLSFCPDPGKAFNVGNGVRAVWSP
jgi:hypothetical protein